MKVSDSNPNIIFQESITSSTLFSQTNSFQFLNLKKTFEKEIDWEYSGYGKLWTYNLHYFEYLHQENITTEEGLLLIKDFIKHFSTLKTAREPYPISLRLIFWIRFLLKNKIKDTSIDSNLYQQAYILADNLEYHLMGNHLLENGFGLYFAAYYFNDTHLYKKAQSILLPELKEQVLADGAHFELCPMYHCIILYRILDCYNLTMHNPTVFNSGLQMLLKEKAALMLGWLKNMQYESGSLPRFGDSTEGIAPTSIQLFNYAIRLSIEPQITPLSTSGYRRLKNEKFDLIAKVGAIGPDYIPGHAHADSLSFELYVDNKPFIVDVGISTYEKNDRRQLERSTKSHNTVEINSQNSSDVWGGFRVGKRAKTKLLSETPNIAAEHNGFNNATHRRVFELRKSELEILDFIDTTVGKAYFHFHPNHKITVSKNRIQFEQGYMHFSPVESIEIETYDYPPQYNTYLSAQKVVVTFKEFLKTIIEYP